MKFIGIALVFVLFLASQGTAQSEKADSAAIAPLPHYLMPRDPEIILAPSTAPKSVSDDAEIFVLTKNGFQTAVKGTNSFICMVARSWSAGYDDPASGIQSYKLRSAITLSPARSQVPATIQQTQVVIAGGSQAQIQAAIGAAIKNGELHTAETGSIAYYVVQATYLNNRVDHWRPHVMFFTPDVDPKSWGSGVPDSPILGLAGRMKCLD